MAHVIDGAFKWQWFQSRAVLDQRFGYPAMAADNFEQVMMIDTSQDLLLSRIEAQVVRQGKQTIIHDVTRAADHMKFIKHSECAGSLIVDIS